jgi:hypothetical protein
MLLTILSLFLVNVPDANAKDYHPAILNRIKMEIFGRPDARDRGSSSLRESRASVLIQSEPIML